MSDQANVQLIKDAYDAFARGDVEGLIATLSDDVEWEVPGPPEVPYAGVFRGKAGVGDFFRILADTEDVQFLEAEAFVASGDRVVVLGHYSALVKSTGRTSHADWVHSFVVRGGKVAKFREYYDTAKYAQAYRTAPAGAAT